MIGWLSLEACRGWRIREEELRLEGLRIWKVTVPLPEGLGPRGERRRLDRAARALRGPRRVPPGGDGTPCFGLAGTGSSRAPEGGPGASVQGSGRSSGLRFSGGPGGVPRQSAARGPPARRVDGRILKLPVPCVLRCGIWRFRPGRRGGPFPLAGAGIRRARPGAWEGCPCEAPLQPALRPARSG